MIQIKYVSRIIVVPDIGSDGNIATWIQSAHDENSYEAPVVSTANSIWLTYMRVAVYASSIAYTSAPDVHGRK